MTSTLTDLATPLKLSVGKDNFEALELNKATGRQHIAVRIWGKLELIPVNAITCFKSDNKYTVVFWGTRQILIEESLKSLERDLSELFIRVHRNALVNKASIDYLVSKDSIAHLKKYSDKVKVVLKDSLELDVSRRHLSSVRKFIKS